MEILAVKQFGVFHESGIVRVHFPSAVETADTPPGAPVFTKVTSRHVIVEIAPEMFSADAELNNGVYIVHFPENKRYAKAVVRPYDLLQSGSVFVPEENSTVPLFQAKRDPELVVMQDYFVSALRLEKREKEVQLVRTIGMA
ncbi:MAG: hypothetical protein ACP5T3_01405 [Candidatus Micrarchaeia archaeon]